MLRVASARRRGHLLRFHGSTIAIAPLLLLCNSISVANLHGAARASDDLCPVIAAAAAFGKLCARVGIRFATLSRRSTSRHGGVKADVQGLNICDRKLLGSVGRRGARQAAIFVTQRRQPRAEAFGADPLSPCQCCLVAFRSGAHQLLKLARAERACLDLNHVGSAPSDDHENMIQNVGTVDRVIRIPRWCSADRGKPAGLHRRLGWIGILSPATGLFRVCSAHLPFGLSTISVKTPSTKP